MNSLTKSKQFDVNNDQQLFSIINKLACSDEKSLKSLAIKSKNYNDSQAFLTHITLNLLESNKNALNQVLLQSIHIKNRYLTNLRNACICLCNGQADDAINTLVEIAKAPFANPLLALLVAEAQLIKCQYTEAFYNFSKAANDFTANQQLSIKAHQCLQQIEATKYSEPLVQGAVDYLKDERFDSREISKLICSLIKFKYKSNDNTSNKYSFQLDTLSKDEFLIEALKRILIIDQEIELFLLEVRNSLLNYIINSGEIPKQLNNLLCALAQQAYINEYVYYINKNEIASLTKIQSFINDLLVKPNPSLSAIAGLILLVALYEPLSQQPYFEQLLHYSIQDWPIEMQPCIEKILFQQKQEITLAKEIPQLTTINNPVSANVKNQYEENPYPRWTEVTKLTSDCNYIKYYHIDKPPFIKPKFSTKSLKMLVAGCGTGKHPISQALLFPDIHIIAVDLSSRSLAYAKIMSDYLHVKNISFYQGDILQLDALKEKFHIIECVGVLHHMEQPEKGLAVLRRLLTKQGIMKIGLYSQAARKEIEKFRANNALAPTLDNIRKFRYQALTEPSEDFNTFIGLNDFYSTSMCRDLLFHAQEHRYTITEIANLLKKYTLSFKGFYFRSHEIFNNFQKQFPNKVSMQDLQAWHQFEQKNPLTFMGMYQFFAQAV